MTADQRPSTPAQAEAATSPEALRAKAVEEAAWILISAEPMVELSDIPPQFQRDYADVNKGWPHVQPSTMIRLKDRLITSEFFDHHKESFFDQGFKRALRTSLNTIARSTRSSELSKEFELKRKLARHMGQGLILKTRESDPSYKHAIEVTEGLVEGFKWVLGYEELPERYQGLKGNI
jgi:hypothetical protein